MKYMLRILLLAIFLTAAAISFAQERDQIAPPSPEAAGLGSFGNTPVSLYTGTPGISIPVWELAGRESSVPISLSYSGAGGIKVEEVATWAGLGWNLQAGGVITRTVNGFPDEGTVLYNGTEVAGGYANLFESYPVYTRLARGYPAADGYERGEYHAMLLAQKALLAGSYETQPDFLFYNFNGYAGKLLIDPVTGEPRSMPYRPWKIETPYGPEGSPYLNASGNWKVTTEDGTVYTFSRKEETSNQAPEGTTRYTSSWYLSTIISPNKIDRIDFHYELITGIAIDANLAKQEYEEWPLPGDPRCGSGHSESAPQESNQTIDQQFLRAIENNYGQRVEFSSDRSRVDHEGGKRLTAIKIFDQGRQIKQYDLYYSYFDSRTTKSELVTLADRYLLRLRLDSIAETGTRAGQSLRLPAYTFDYDDTPLPSRKSPNMDYWGYYNGAKNESLIPEKKHVNGIRNYNMPGGDRNPNADYMQAGVLTRINYPTGGYTDYVYEPHTIYGFPTLNEEYALQEFATGVTGGLDSTQIYCMFRTNGSDCGDDGFRGIPKMATGSFFLSESQEVLIETSHYPGQTLENSATDLYMPGVAQSSMANELGFVGIWPITEDPFADNFQTWFSNSASDQTQIRIKTNVNEPSYSITKRLEPGIYNFVAATTVDSSRLSVRISWLEELPKDHNANTVVGGLRIQEIRDYPNDPNNPPVIRRYAYTDHNYERAKVGTADLTDTVPDPIFVTQYGNVLDLRTQQDLPYETTPYKSSGVLFGQVQTDEIKTLEFDYPLTSFFGAGGSITEGESYTVAITAQKVEDDTGSGSEGDQSKPSITTKVSVTTFTPTERTQGEIIHKEDYHCEVLTRRATSQFELGRTHGSHVGYSQVTELLLDSGEVRNGYTVYEYINSNQGQSRQFPYAPHSNEDDYNGLLLRKRSYDSAGLKVDELVNEYRFPYTHEPLVSTISGEPYRDPADSINFKQIQGYKMGMVQPTARWECITRDTLPDGQTIETVERIHPNDANYWACPGTEYLELEGFPYCVYGQYAPTAYIVEYPDSIRDQLSEEDLRKENPMPASILPAWKKVIKDIYIPEQGWIPFYTLLKDLNSEIQADSLNVLIEAHNGAGQNAPTIRQRHFYAKYKRLRAPEDVAYDCDWHLQVDRVAAGGYDLTSRWFYQKSSQQRVYAPGDTTRYLETSTEFYYDNPRHARQTGVLSVKSSGEAIYQQIVYPADFAPGTEPFIDSLQSRHMLGIPIRQQTWQFSPIDTTLLSSSYTTYRQEGTMIKTDSVNVLELAQPLEIPFDPADPVPGSVSQGDYSLEKHYDRYDAYGNVQEVVYKDGTPLAYLYGYDSLLPVAEVVNARVTEIAYTSFESADDGGGWTFNPNAALPHTQVAPGSTQALSIALTGDQVYQLSDTATISSITLPAGSYALSYWYQAGTVSMQTSATTPDMQERSGPDGWQLRELRLQAAADFTVTLSGTALLDELRLFPERAQMSTYTYEIGTGLSTATDTDNRVSHYHYDALGRLLDVRDLEGNLIATYDYHYGDRPITINPFEIDQRYPIKGQTVTFDASNVLAAKPSLAIQAQYVWDYGDGSQPDTTSSTTSSHTYGQTGKQEVSLSVLPLSYSFPLQFSASLEVTDSLSTSIRRDRVLLQTQFADSIWESVMETQPNGGSGQYGYDWRIKDLKTVNPGWREVIGGNMLLIPDTTCLFEVESLVYDRLNPNNRDSAVVYGKLRSGFQGQYVQHVFTKDSISTEIIPDCGASQISWYRRSLGDSTWTYLNDGWAYQGTSSCYDFEFRVDLIDPFDTLSFIDTIRADFPIVIKNYTAAFVGAGGLPFVSSPPDSALTLPGGRDLGFGLQASGGCSDLSYTWQSLVAGQLTTLPYTSDSISLQLCESSQIRVIVADAVKSDMVNWYVTVTNPMTLSWATAPASGAVGETLSLSGQVSDGCGPFTYAWERRAVGTSNWSSFGGNSLSANSLLACDPTEVRLTVTDAGGRSNSISHQIGISANPGLSLSLSPVTAQTLAPLQSRTFTAMVTGHCGSPQISWVKVLLDGTEVDLGATGTSYTHTASCTAEAFTLKAVAIDQHSTVAAQVAINETAPAALSASWQSPPPASLAAGQSHTWQVNASGGCGTLSYAFERLVFVPGTGIWEPVQTGSSASYSTSGTHNFKVRCTVTDQNGNSLLVVAGGTVQVSLGAVSISSADADQSFTVNSPQGGQGSLSYAWAYDLLSDQTTNWISTGSNSTSLLRPATGGESFRLRVTVTDQSNPQQSRVSADYEVIEPMTGSISGAASMPRGASETYSLTGFSGGKAPYTYRWRIKESNTILGNGSAQSFSISCADRTLELAVTDARGVALVKEKVISVNGNNLLSVGISTNTTLGTITDGAYAVQNLSGNCGAYSFAWYKRVPNQADVSLGTGTSVSLPADCSLQSFSLVLRVTDTKDSYEAVLPITAVEDAPGITASWAAGTYPTALNAGQPHTVSVQATGGCGPLSYRFQRLTYAPGSGEWETVQEGPNASYTTSSTTDFKLRCFVYDGSTGTTNQWVYPASDIRVNLGTVAISSPDGGLSYQVTPPQGGRGTLSYAWEYDLLSDQSTNWTATGTNNTSILRPVAAEESFRLRVTVSDGSSPAQTVSAPVLEVVEAMTGSINGAATLARGEAQSYSLSGFSGGKAPYSYQWRIKETNTVIGTGSSVSYTGDCADRTLELRVTDGKGTVLVREQALTISGNALLTASIGINTAQGTTTAGSYSVSGLTGNCGAVAYTWLRRIPNQADVTLGSGSSLTIPADCSDQTFTLVLQLSDSKGNYETNINVTAVDDSVPLVGNFGSLAAMTTGASQTVNISASGGCGGYTYTWYQEVKGAGGSTSWSSLGTGATSQSITAPCYDFRVRVLIEDGLGHSTEVISAPIAVSGTAPPTVTVSRSPAGPYDGPIDVTWTASTSGGCGPASAFQYSWTFYKTSGTILTTLSGSSATINGLNESTNLTLTVTDLDGQATQANDGVVVNPGSTGGGGGDPTNEQ